MRSGLVIAIVAAIAVVIGAAYWYSNAPTSGFVDMVPGDDAGPPETEVVGPDPAADPDPEMAEPMAQEPDPLPDTAILPEATEPETVPDAEAEAGESAADGPVTEPAPAVEDVVPDDAAGLADPADTAGAEPGDAAGTDTGAARDDPIVVGDPITEDAIVVDSATDEAVVLEPTEEPSVTFPETGDGTGDGAAGTGGTTADLPPDALLTPSNFDPDAVVSLLDQSEAISDTERSTLTALVEGAGENPQLIDAAIGAIRAALDLPALE